jgi:hypothetical protein
MPPTRPVAAGLSALLILPLVAVFSLEGQARAENGGETAGPGGWATPEAVPSPFPIPRLKAPIRMTGGVDDPVWDRIDPLPMVMFAPTFGEPVSEHTEVRIAHDGEHLYVSARMYDSEPDRIRTNTFYRDQYAGDDLFAVVIDSFNDRETGLWFTTNPAGTRGDRSVSNDAVFSGAGMGIMNFDWNAHWDVETTQNDEGWFAELRIPFSSIGFQVVDGEVTMGIIVYRFVARKNERQIFPAIDPRWGGMAFAKPSQAHRIVLRGVEQATPLYVTPFLLGGASRIPRVGEGMEGVPEVTTATDPTTEVGLDLRYAPAANLTLDLTLNTDFAQVEADDQQINLTRFPLFFPEKRQFFQERSSTFQFPTGRGPDRLFHSRRIGLEAGEIVRIYGGGRAVGRMGGTDFGLLVMQAEGPAGTSSRNMGVARVSQEVLNPYSSVGAMVTSRLGTDDGDNVAVGVDSSLRLFGDEWLDLRWARSFDETIREESFLEAGTFRARWERIRDEGLSYAGEALRVGRDYNPGLGFQARRDYHFLGARTQYKSFRDAYSPLRSVAFQVGTQHFYRNREGTPVSRAVEPQVQWEFKGGSQVSVKSTSSFESLRAPFSIADVEIPEGDYWFHAGEVQYQRSRSDLLRGSVTLSAGTFYDGTRVGLSMDPTWTQSRYLELGGGYEVNRLDFSERDVATTTHLARARVQVALNTRLSFSTLAQYSNVADLASANARFRYHFREGTDLWVVYNEGWNTDRSPLDREFLPVSAGRTLMVKYTRAFLW